MDGFTGLDVERAKSDIQNFVSRCKSADTSMYYVMAELANVLFAKWASPVAVEFSKEFNEKYNTLSSDFATAVKHIESGAVQAATTLARANGAHFSYDGELAEAGQAVHYSDNTFICDEEKNGTVGMDTENVKVALDVFKGKAQSVLNDLNEVPDGIAFYDPNGEMVGSYNRNISEFKLKYNDLYNEICTALSGYIETETDNILLAKEQATQQMSA